MILIATQCFPPDIGGIQSIVGGLAKSAAEQGFPVTVMAEATTGDRAYDEAAGYDVVRYSGLRPLRRLLKARAANRIISSGKPTAVFCDSWKSVEHLSPAGAPIVVFAHGMEYPPDATPGKKARISRALSKVKAVVADSRFAADLARPYVPETTRIAVVNPAIMPLQDASNAAAALRGQHGHPIIAGLARLEPRKGFDRVIEALPVVAERHPDVSFLIGGDGSDRVRLQELAVQLGVAQRVHFFGNVAGERKSALLAAADLFAMPTRRVGSSVEGFGIVYAEAAWFGVPAVAGVEGGAGDFVEDGVTGRLVDGDKPISDALLDLLSDSDRLKAMGRAAQNKVRSTGMWDQTFARIMELAQSPERRGPRGMRP
jgi:phosphatidylinositol alpha-1,6-mannosyltransferase